jgi:hypothetical protein
MRGLLPGSAFNGATVPRQQLLFAYPHFSNVSISNLPIGGQSYHSLQMKGTRRYSNGIATQFSYTWAKMLERVSQLNAQDTDLGNLLNTGLEQRLAEWDIPHTFSATVAYELPFGKNKRFFGNMNSFADAFFGGWNVNILHMRRSGTPVEFPNAAPIVARSAKLTASQRDELARAAGRDKFNPFFDKWFDTSVFPRTAQAAFTLRDFPTRFPDVRHDGLQSWEISVYKEFRIRERVRTQIRADFQNAFDYAHFGRLVTRPNNVQDTRFGQLDPAQGNQPRIVVLVAKIIF